MAENRKARGALTLPKAMSGAQGLVLEYLKTLPRGRLLDMPAGQGYLAEKSLQMGFCVECCDIDPGHFQLQGIECKRVNLNRDTLPYASGSFDVVVSVGGLHRLFNPRNAISEAWRVLVPGGLFLVGLKNYSTLRRRLLFLVSGFHGRNIVTQSCVQTIEDPEARFRFPLTAPHLSYLLQKAGFSLRKIKADGISFETFALFPLVLLIKALGTMRKNYYSRKMGMEYSDPLSILMAKNYMLMVSQKPQAAPQAPGPL